MSDASYDVFLSHNSKDKPLVRELATLLAERGLRVFFDEWELAPGLPFQEVLERAIETAKSVAILYGPSGIGPWEKREMQACLQVFVERALPVIPVLLPGSGATPHLPLFLRPFTWVDLRSGPSPESLQKLCWGITGQKPPTLTPTPFRLWNVPPLPNEFQPREELGPLKRALLSTEMRTFASLGQHARFAIQGMGGVGKSVLAAALARDPDIGRAFPGGIFWLTLGHQPEDALLMQARLATAVGGAQLSIKRIEQGKSALRDLFTSRACLLVLDDVWNTRDIEPFDALDEHSTLLVTTRKAEISDGIGAYLHELHELPTEDALGLLARYADLPRETLPPEARALAKECGELPLALAMAGSVLRRRPRDRWPELLARLRSADLDRLRKILPGYPHDSIRAAIEVSVEDLPESTCARYLDLAVFPEDIAIPESALSTFWAPASLSDVQDTIDTLVDRSLVRRGDKGRLTLHDLQYDYVRARAGELKPLHARLLAAYSRLSAGKGLHSVPDDGYFYQHLAHHLAAAEGPNALRALLFDARWLAAKLAATETNALLADFQHLDLDADEPAGLLHDALRLSSHVLDRHAKELAAQLVGRLGDEDAPELRALVNEARAHAPRPGILPVWPRLTPPGGPLLRSFAGHPAWVTTVAISADGKYAVSGSHDRTLKLWRLQYGTLIRSFEGHQGWVTSVALSPDAKHAVSGSSDKTVKVWELASGKRVHSFEGHQGGVTAVAISPDGQHVVSASEDETLKLWELASGKLVRTFEGHRGSVLAVAISPDGQYVVSGSEDKALNRWELASGALVRSIKGHRGSVLAVAISPDGRLAMTGSEDKTLRLWELDSGELMRSFGSSRDGVTAIAISPDGRHALSGSYVDPPDDFRSKTFTDPNGLQLWELDSGKQVRSFHNCPMVKAVAITPDGRFALSSSDDNSLKLWELGSGDLVRFPHEHQDIVKTVAISPDGTHALSGSYDNTLKLWELPSGKHVRSFESGRRVHAVVITPDGAHALSGSSDQTLKLWELSSGKLLRSFEGHQGRIKAVALDKIGKLALSGSEDRTLKLWEVPSGELIRSFEAHLKGVSAVALSPDGRSALSGSLDETLKLWELPSGEYVHSFEGHRGGITSIAISPDGKWVLAGSQVLRLWELATGKLVSSFDGDRAVLAVAISPDGRYVLSSSGGKALKLWELTTARVLASFTAEASFYALAYHPDCRHVVAGDESGRVHLLEMRV